MPCRAWSALPMGAFWFAFGLRLCFAARVAKWTEPRVKERLREAGLKITPPRVSVLRLLSGGGRPLSHSEVVEKLGSGPWDQATLYRNLRKLVESGLLRVTSHVGGVDRYEIADGGEAVQGVHPHFACRSCGVVSCLPEAALELPVAEEWRSALLHAEVQFVGVCPGCSSP